MWKLCKCLSSFFNYCFNRQLAYAFNFNFNIDQNLLAYLSIKRIYKFRLDIRRCINSMKIDMYNPEKNGIFISKNPKSQTIRVENIHKITDPITIYRGKSLILCSQLSH